MQKIAYGRSMLMATLLASGLLIAGCRQEDQGPVTITETRQAAPLQRIPPELKTEARLGLTALPPNHPPLEGASGVGLPAANAATPSASPLAWTLPEGWTQGPERPMRLATFLVGSPVAGDLECSVTELGGMGGGVAANFNRWQGQLGQPSLSEADMAALPRITVLGTEAPLLEVTGTYTGMGETSQAGSKLLGTMAASGDRAFFVKLVGSAAAVDAQRENFNAFCGSLKLGGE